MREAKRKSQAGQSILLVTVGLSIFLLGAIGLAVDGSQLYAQRQLAQAAADAAAEAGILSIYDGTNTAGTHKFYIYGTGGTCTTNTGTPGQCSYTCTASDAATPCYYAQKMNGFSLTNDTVIYTANPSVTIPSLSGSDPVNLLKVTVTRKAQTTFMGMLGASGLTIGATGISAIVSVASPVPIIITHPSMANALNMNGHTGITITGGPQRSIQVNSSDPGAYSGPSSGSVDLAAAGPSGTGGDFGVYGGPTSNPGNVNLGTTGHYISPASPIQDPLANISAPSGVAATTTPGGVSCTTTGHCSGCPGGASTCTEYEPGSYTGGINIKTSTAMLDPGVYVMQGGGFTTKNSTVGMCPVPSVCSSNLVTAGGMVVYDTGSASGGCDVTGGFTIDTKSNDIFYGAGISQVSPTAAPTSPYYGILFFEDRSACAQSHNLGQGNGCFSLIGTIYITNTQAIMEAKPSQHQSVTYNGTPCTGVNNYGEIIVSQLSVVGTSGITMGLFPQSLVTVRQVALVQ